MGELKASVRERFEEVEQLETDPYPDSVKLGLLLEYC
jgi:hypothetical protein